jgi:glycosyltransferase involved in cell wall biosynthesis
VTPHVDIVFTIWRETSTTQRSLLQLYRNTRQPCSIIVVSADGSVAQNSNAGFDRCRSEIIASVDDDVYVPPGWLDRLVETLQAHPDAGAVGPKILGSTGLPNLNGNGADTMLWCPRGEVKQAAPHFVSGCCFVMRAADGYRYSEEFIGSGWEDTDLFRQMHADGKALWVDGRVEVEHLSRKLNNSDHYVDNCRTYHRRWPTQKGPRACMCCGEGKTCCTGDHDLPKAADRFISVEEVIARAQ